MKRKEFGKYGEDRAVKFLRKSGYRIIERNFRNRLGEIDIIARDGEVITFVEVKSRQDNQFGSPLEAIDHRKMHQLGKVALSFIKARGLSEARCRFDVLALSAGTKVPNDEIALIKDAFPLDPRYLY